MPQKNTTTKNMPDELTQIQSKADKQALDEIAEIQKKLEETQAQLKKFARIQQAGTLTPKQDKEYNALQKEATTLKNELDKIYEVTGLKPEKNSIGKAFDKFSQNFDNMFKSDKTSDKVEKKETKKENKENKVAKNNKKSETFKEFGKEIGNNVKNATSSIAENVIVKPIETVSKTGKTIFGGIKNLFSSDDKVENKDADKKSAEQTKKSSIPSFSDIVSKKSDSKQGDNYSNNESYNARESSFLASYNNELKSLQGGNTMNSTDTMESKESANNIVRHRA